MISRNLIIKKFEEAGWDNFLTDEMLNKIQNSEFEIPGISGKFKVVDIDWQRVKAPFIVSSENDCYKMRVCDVAKFVLDYTPTPTVVDVSKEMFA